MAKFKGSSLIFDEDDVRRAGEPLPRLIRIIFYAMDITVDKYMDRYLRFLRETRRDRTPKENATKAAADRKTLIESENSVTFKMMNGALQGMGFDIESVSVRFRDRATGEVHCFSTDDDVNSVNEFKAREKSIGLDSF